MVGIPASGDLSTTWFYKMGVRVGSKSFVPQSSRLYEGYWDDDNPFFENTYEQSTQRGDAFMESFAVKLYDSIPEHFEQMSTNRKQRVKQLLLRLNYARWSDGLKNLPLFHSSAGSWKLALKDLIHLEDRFGSLPYAIPGTAKTPAFLPYLETEDRVFLQEQLHFILQLRQDPVLLPRPSEGTVGEVLVNDQLPAGARQMVALIAQFDPMTQLRFSRDRFWQERDALGRKVLFLPLPDERVQAAIAGAVRSKADWIRLKYDIMSS